MRYAVLGTGTVGQTLGRKLVSLGHEVRMGSRDPAGKAQEWAAQTGGAAGAGTFAEAAESGEVVINATAGAASLEALGAAGAENLAGKTLLDVANPLDFSQGMPPTLAVCNTDSLGERIQRTFPDARVVKSLNTVNADIMVEPGIVPGGHTMFVCGDHAGAKRDVTALLVEFGWPESDVLDLGGISAARGMEMYLPLWLRLLQATGTGHLNVRVSRA